MPKTDELSVSSHHAGGRGNYGSKFKIWGRGLSFDDGDSNGCPTKHRARQLFGRIGSAITSILLQQLARRKPIAHQICDIVSTVSLREDR